MNRINAKRLKRFALHQLGLESYLRDPGDGRPRPQIPAAVIIWALLIGQIVRRSSYHGVEELVRSPARSALEVSRRFSEDSLGYCTEKLQAAKLRAANQRGSKGGQASKIATYGRSC